LRLAEREQNVTEREQALGARACRDRGPRSRCGSARTA
jgi:hypothetical protein